MTQHITRAEDLPVPAGVYEIQFRNIPMTYVNFANTNEAEFLTVIQSAERMIRKPGNEGKVITLTNMDKAKYNPVTMKAVDLYAKANEPYVLARSVIGLNDMKRIAFNFIQRISRMNMRAHDSPLDALEWLAGEVRNSPLVR